MHQPSSSCDMHTHACTHQTAHMHSLNIHTHTNCNVHVHTRCMKMHTGMFLHTCTCAHIQWTHAHSCTAEQQEGDASVVSTALRGAGAMLFQGSQDRVSCLRQKGPSWWGLRTGQWRQPHQGFARKHCGACCPHSTEALAPSAELPRTSHHFMSSDFLERTPGSSIFLKDIAGKAPGPGRGPRGQGNGHAPPPGAGKLRQLVSRHCHGVASVSGPSSPCSALSTVHPEQQHDIKSLSSPPPRLLPLTPCQLGEARGRPWSSRSAHAAHWATLRS